MYCRKHQIPNNYTRFNKLIYLDRKFVFIFCFFAIYYYILNIAVCVRKLNKITNIIMCVRRLVKYSLWIPPTIMEPHLSHETLNESHMILHLYSISEYAFKIQRCCEANAKQHVYYHAFYFPRHSGIKSLSMIIQLY